MKIHSSSLATIPARYNANNQNETPKTSSREKQDSLHNSYAPEHQTPIQIQTNLKTANLQLIPEKPQNSPINFHIHQALNAYIQENNQPLKNQRSELITGIDVFV